MIFWNGLKIQSGNGLVNLNTNNTYGKLEITKGMESSAATLVIDTIEASKIEASKITVASAMHLPAGTTFQGSVSLPAGSSFNGPITIPTSSTFAGSVTLPAGSSFAGPVDIPGGSTGRFDTLDVTENLTVGKQVKLDLADGSTYNGAKFVTWPKQAGFWLDAYQGPGSNWITIRNYTNVTLTVSSLEFSGNIWDGAEGHSSAVGDIAPHGEWTDSAYNGWGSNDNPSPITLTYSASNHSDSTTETFAVAKWTADGGVLFGEEGSYPGQLLLRDNHSLVILYSSTVNTDVQSWYAFAQSLGYTQSATYFGAVVNPSSTTAGSLDGNTRLAGTYILTVRK